MGIDDGDLDTDENGGEKQTTQVVLNYDALLNSRINKKIDTIKKEEKRVIDIFKIESWIIGTITLIIGILSKIGLFTLEAKDITLMGIAIALFLIPYAGKLKILGIEFERFKIDKNEDNNKKDTK